MATSHNLGYPRIGAARELKWALEQYWAGGMQREALLQVAANLCERHWRAQADAGLDQVPVGDFSLYDHVLDHAVMLGAIPDRFGGPSTATDLDTMFRMARGRAPSGEDVEACEMTKWFNTNYHYLVPELHRGQRFALSSNRLFDEIQQAATIHPAARPVITGPLTWLMLAKARGGSFNKLDLLDGLLPVYREILVRLADLGVSWVQVDEPILVQDLPRAWQFAFQTVYRHLCDVGPNILLTTYFGALEDNLSLVCSLPVHGVHVDAVSAPCQLVDVLEALPPCMVLSAGVVDGRNIWRSDLAAKLEQLEPVHDRLGDRLWLAPSCSLLHVPVDLSVEDTLAPETKSWLAFARQKIDEVKVLTTALNEGRDTVRDALDASCAAARSRRTSPLIRRADVRKRMASIDEDMANRRAGHRQRRQSQRDRLDLPMFPTTTIGSFPQTPEIRRARGNLKAGRIDHATYLSMMQGQIDDAIRRQEALGLDVLVHGEPERNDMVEYFGEQLDGFMFTSKGWVQSYGSRCVKPPIIYGDVARPRPMTVDWILYAQSRTDRLVKGMLTGPVTMLNWSFVRDDQPRSETAFQIALAIRDEVLDLERSGVGIIQIDEAALREGLPLRRARWQDYLDWAVRAFRLAANGVRDETQVHTHMCYSEFNEIMEFIADMDADVITIETSRSDGELLEVFEHFRYPNDIGPGVYDIHSPKVPTLEQMTSLLRSACQRISPDQLWVNPDCGLKTRRWKEVTDALANMVAAARLMREEHGQSTGR